MFEWGRYDITISSPATGSLLKPGARVNPKSCNEDAMIKFLGHEYHQIVNESQTIVNNIYLPFSNSMLDCHVTA